MNIGMKFAHRGLTPPVVGWCLLDFSLSLLMVSGGMYFSKWLVIDLGAGDWVFNLVVAISTIMSIVFAQYLGVSLDLHRRHLKALRGLLWQIGLGATIVGVVARLDLATNHKVIFASVGFGLSLIGAQLFANVFNATIRHVASAEGQLRASGLSVVSGWLGAICGIALTLPFVSGAIPGFSAGRYQAFLPAVAFFFIFATLGIRMLAGAFLEPASNAKEGVTKFVPIGWTPLKRKEVMWFLVFFMLTMDAIITIQNNLPIFMSRVFSMSDAEQSFVFLAVSLAGAAGGFIGAALKTPSNFDALLVCAFLWVVLTAGVAVSPSADIFVALFVCCGVLLGVTLSLSRVAFLRFVPLGSEGQYFAVYGVLERFASLTGPLVWSGTLLLNDSSVSAYRYAMATMTLLFFLGLASLLIVRKVKVSL